MSTTTYDLLVRFRTEDGGAASTIKKIGDSASHAERQVKGFQFGLGHLAGALSGAFLLNKAKHAFLEFNSDLEQTKISMAGIAAYNLEIPFSKAADQTERMMLGFREFSRTTPFTGAEVTHFAKGVSAAVFGAGKNIQQLEEFTKKATPIADILGQQHPGGMRYVALELSEALMGNLKKTQMANMQLLTPIFHKYKMEHTEWNRKTTEERYKMMMEAFASPAWTSALEAQRNSFKGIISTFRSEFEYLAAKVGEPLFKRITAEIKKWNEWLEKNKDTVSIIGNKFTDAMMFGFDYVKSTLGWVIDHKTEIMAIAGSFLALKGLSGIAGLAGGLAGGLGGGTGLIGFTSALTNATSVITTFAGLFVVGGVLWDAYNSRQIDKDARANTQIAHIEDYQKYISDINRAKDANTVGATPTGHADVVYRAIIQASKDAHAIDETTATIKYNVLEDYLKTATNLHDTQVKDIVGLTKEAYSLYSQGGMAGPAIFKLLGLKWVEDDGARKPGDSKGGNTINNNTIQRVEVASDDPDRFVMEMSKAFMDMGRKRTSAAASRGLGGHF